MDEEKVGLNSERLVEMEDINPKHNKASDDTDDFSLNIDSRKSDKKSNGKIMKQNMIKKKKSFRTSLVNFRNKEKESLTQNVKQVLKSESLMSNNNKSLSKEKKINDTIVALISFCIILISFYQLYTLIEEDYYLSYKILTLRTCILILSIPNCKIFFNFSNFHL